MEWSDWFAPTHMLNSQESIQTTLTEVGEEWVFLFVQQVVPST
jgi:hypothetical protein